VVSLFLVAVLCASTWDETNAFSSSPLSLSPLLTSPQRAASTRKTAFFFAAQSDDANDNENENNDDDENNNNNNNDNAEAAKWREQARELREQIQKMEADLPDRPISDERAAALDAARKQAEQNAAASLSSKPVSLLDGKRVLLVGANGRLGSMVCRRLLREYPEIREVVAMVHVVGENSEVSRGYGRLAYEVGAEDGRGSIGPAWSADDRVATFEFDEERMTPYNLQKLRIVECELLDPVQCRTIVEDARADVIVWCATDFNGSTPRALSGGSGPLSGLPFLFRAVADPDKGRVEVEGLQNMLGALKNFKQEAIQRKRKLTAFSGTRRESPMDDGVPGDKAVSASSGDNNDDSDKGDAGIDVLLVSSCPDALGNFETPFGSFLDIKRQGEDMIPKDFPSLRYSVLQFATFEDNFVGEDLELKLLPVENEAPRVAPSDGPQEQQQQQPEQKRQRKVRRINRRDAARAVGDALVDPDFHNKKIQVWTNEVG